MTTLPDSAGLITSTDDPHSLEAFEQALASLFRSDGNALPVIERAIERDPAFNLGHCLQLYGTGSPRRWHEVTRLWLRRHIIGNRAFDLVHAVMALAASKQHAIARRLAKRLESDTILRAHSGNAELALAGPLIAAIMSFSRGDYDGAVESIPTIRAAADRCGGGVTQCDLIHLTLLEAALRAHRERLAQTLAADRARRKPASRLNRWPKARAGPGHQCAGNVSVGCKKRRRLRDGQFSCVYVGRRPVLVGTTVALGRPLLVSGRLGGQTPIRATQRESNGHAATRPEMPAAISQGLQGLRRCSY